MPKSVSHLDRKTILNVYTHLKKRSVTGRVTSAIVARELSKYYLNAFTGKPFTRQWVHKVLNLAPRGEASLKHMPIISLHPDYPLISKWFAEHYPQAEHVPYEQITPELAEGRDIYGQAPLASMMAARNIYWLFFGEFAILYDTNPDDFEKVISELTIQKLKCVRIY